MKLKKEKISRRQKQITKEADRIEKEIREIEALKQELARRGIEVQSRPNISDDALHLGRRISGLREIALLHLTLSLSFSLFLAGLIVAFGIAILAAL